MKLSARTRADVVELLRCAADICGVGLSDRRSVFPIDDATDELYGSADSHRGPCSIFDLACYAVLSIGRPVSLEQLLEAALLVEEGKLL